MTSASLLGQPPWVCVLPRRRPKELAVVARHPGEPTERWFVRVAIARDEALEDLQRLLFDLPGHDRLSVARRLTPAAAQAFRRYEDLCREARIAGEAMIVQAQ